MKIKRAIGYSILAYIASFVAGTVIAVMFGINLGETQEIPPLLWYAGAVAAVAFAVLFARWYFHSPEIHPSGHEGFRFGIVMIITGFVLDFITLLPLMAHEDPWGPILAYYADPLFWATLVAVLVGTTMTGRYLGEGTIS